MKGDKERPMCGFSKAVVQILEMENAEFDTYNVLSDDKVREGIKRFSDWPTIPQVFIKGEFVGGCDILLQLYKEGTLGEMLKDAGALKIKEK